MVESNPLGIDCGSNCLEDSSDFLINSLITLMATPSSDSSFSGWGGACSGFGNCSLTINNNVSVAANFIKMQSQNQTQMNSSSTIATEAKILISEVMVGKTDNANYEFVEFYNAGASSVDLTDWSIKRITSDNSLESLLTPINFKGKIIEPGKYFLTADKSNEGIILADVFWPVSYLISNKDKGIALYNDNSEKVDEVIWPETPKDYSYERTSWDSSNFQIQPNPNPQNSGM